MRVSSYLLLILFLLLAVHCAAGSAHAQASKTNADASKFDEYVLEGDDVHTRLVRFARRIKLEPAAKQGYVIVYARRKQAGAGVKYDGEEWKRWAFYNLEAQGLKKEQYVIVYGGLREEAMIELWIVAKGARMPVPTPTARQEESVFCPAVNISGGFVFDRAQPLTFKAELSPGANPDHNLKSFNWTVSAGRIVSGQGTDTITVDASGSSDRAIRVSVEVQGLAPECENRSSTLSTLGLMPFNLDSFSNISCEDLKARLDNLAIYLQQQPELQGHIITYGGRIGMSNEAGAYAAAIKDYLVNTRGMDASRIVITDGGFREKLSGELWLTKPGAPSPSPTPSVDPKYVTRRGVIKTGYTLCPET
jgi:hypothetical protein